MCVCVCVCVCVSTLDVRLTTSVDDAQVGRDAGAARVAEVVARRLETAAPPPVTDLQHGAQRAFRRTLTCKRRRQTRSNKAVHARTEHDDKQTIFWVSVRWYIACARLPAQAHNRTRPRNCNTHVLGSEIVSNENKAVTSTSWKHSSLNQASHWGRFLLISAAQLVRFRTLYNFSSNQILQPCSFAFHCVLKGNSGNLLVIVRKSH